ncbi:MAG: PaaI family thioesterase [Chloroflexi bacterium]|nr:PaaI family thioesterase [Chloroflexota bacterium]
MVATTRERTRTVSWEDPAIAIDAARTMPGIAYLRAMARGDLASPPVSSLIGMDIAAVEEGRVVLSLVPDEYHYNPMGAVHGGIATTLLDSAMGLAVVSTLPAGTGFTTLELKVNFARALTRATGPVECTGTLINAGSRIVLAEARITDAAGRLYAHATSTCYILRPE